MDSVQQLPTMVLRPYQAMCLVCAFGEHEAGPTDGPLADALAKIREHPDRPVALQCNAGDLYVYQHPGTNADTPEGAEFNRKRDLDILVKLDLAPGSVLPARTLLKRLLLTVTTTAGICGYDTVTGDAWRGCPKAKTGCYEKGRDKGIDAIIPPRTKPEMDRDKTKAVQAMERADAITIRPHILVCAVAQYGGGTRPPYPPDNLPEMLQLILKKPDTPITLAHGADWMMCAPCPSRVDELNGCICGKIASGGLYNELKDLNVLQRLGLTYGTTMPARKLYKLIFDRIPSVVGVCAFQGDIPAHSVWRDGCGVNPSPCPGYAKGRKQLLELLS